MNIFSLVLKIIAGLVAVTILAIGLILATVDPNDHRDKITQLVKKETGRDLQIESMSLSFFPHLGLNLENATLSNATGFSQAPFLQVDKIQVGAAILPLLSQQLEIDTLTLHGLNVSLEKNAQGVSNWDDLVKPGEKTVPEEKKAAAANPMAKLAALNFGGIDIQNGQIHWDDKQTKQAVDLTISKLSTGAITFGEFFQMTLSAQTQVANPELSATLDLTIEAKLEQSGRYSVRNLVLNTTTQGKGLPVNKATIKLAIPTLDLAMSEQTIHLPKLGLDYDIIGGQDFPMQTIQGNLALNDFQGDLSAQQFQAKNLTVKSKMTGETLPGGKTEIAISTRPTINLTAQTAEVADLSIQAMSLNANGSVKASNITSDPLVDAQLNIANTNLRALFAELKITLPEMADATTLTQFSAALAVHFNAKTQALAVNKLKMTLDDSQVTGSASVSQFERPNIRYDLALNKIDLNRYLPPKKAQPVSEETASKEDIEIPLPTELLRKLTIDGTLKAGSVTFQKLQPKNTVVTVKGAKGKFNAQPIRTDIFKTRINAQVRLDVSGKAPKYAVKTDAKKIPIGEVLLAFTGKDQLSGTGSILADISTAGTHLSHLKQNLNGTAAANLTDGAVKGFNLAQSIRQAKAKMSGKTLPPSKEPLQTDFSSFIAEVTIKQGVVATNKLLVQAPFMRITGTGNVDIPKESLDYLVKTKIVGSDKGQGGQELTDLNGLTIPVKLKGAWTSPKVSLDLGSIVEQKTKAEIEKKKQAVVEETKKKVEEQLKDSLLKGFKF